MVQSSFASVVDITWSFCSTQAAKASGTNELTLEQSTLTYAVGVRIASSQLAQESEKGEIRSSYVSAYNFAGVFLRCLIPQLFLKFINSLPCRPGCHTGDLTKISRVGNQNVDEWRLICNCGCCSLQRFFRCHIAHDWNERTVFLNCSQLLCLG